MVEDAESLEEQLAAVPPTAEDQRAQLLNRLAWSLRNRDPKRAFALGEEAWRTAEHLNSDLERAHALLVRSYARSKLSAGEEAYADAQAALALFEVLNDPIGYQRVLNTLGIIHGQLGAYGEALKSFLALKKLQEEQENSRGLADTLNNIAILYVHLSDFTDAVEYHLQSLKICQEIQYRSGEIRSLLNLGVVYLDLTRHEDALEMLERTLRLCSPDEEPVSHINALINIGYCYLGLKRWPEAISYYEQGLVLLERLDNVHSASEALEGLGAAHQGMGQHGAADAYLRRCIEMRTAAGDRKGQAEALRLLAYGHRRQGRLDDAVETLRCALALAEAVGSKTDIYKIHFELATTFREKGDYFRTSEHLLAYASVKDEVINQQSDDKLLALRVGYEVETARREREIYRLRNVELAEANERLEALTATLQTSNEEQRRLLQDLDRLAREDGLTGLFNRRHFETVFSETFASARRYGRNLTVVICDIDDFKQVNDRFSHQVGDEVLKAVARLMQGSVREQDCVARYGGEEFSILLPDTPLTAGVASCERIRQEVESYPWRTIHPQLRVTISMGASADLTVTNHEKLMALADEKLYEAKWSGKNQVRS